MQMLQSGSRESIRMEIWLPNGALVIRTRDDAFPTPPRFVPATRERAGANVRSYDQAWSRRPARTSENEI